MKDSRREGLEPEISKLIQESVERAMLGMGEDRSTKPQPLNVDYSGPRPPDYSLRIHETVSWGAGRLSPCWPLVEAHRE